MDNLFEIATRKKYRYPYRGTISTEDLWDLTRGQLDVVYKALRRAAKDQEADDSLLTVAETDSDTANQIMIVKHIFSVKVAEAEACKTAKENAEKKRRLLEALERKQDESLNAMSEEDLKKMLDEMR